MSDDYSNIRSILGKFIGRTIEDITQHDREEFEETGKSYVQILVSGGDYIKFYVDDEGFCYSEDVAEERGE